MSAEKEQNKKMKKVPPEFGAAMRDEEFSLQPEIVFLNQASYGTTPNQVIEAVKSNLDLQEWDPDTWMRILKTATVSASVVKLAQFIGADPQNLYLEENVTRATNSVLKSIPWASGDVILTNDWIYSGFRDMIEELLQDNPGVSNLVLENPYPIESEEQVLQLYEATLQQNPNIRLALIDHISSLPTVVFPVKALVSLCHQYGVLALIDGAHVPGQLHLDLEDIGADFYIGAMNKWCFTMRGCAMIYVHPSHHDMVRPVVASSGHFRPFSDNFIEQGVRNYAFFVCAATAIDFYEWIGGLVSVHAYCTPLLEASAERISAEYGIAHLEVPPSMIAPLQQMVQIPIIDGIGIGELLWYMREKYGIWVVGYGYMNGYWLRVSCNVYCTEEDFLKLEAAVRDLVENGPDHNVLRQIREKKKVEV